MNSTFYYTIAILSGIGIICGVVLYAIAQKFNVIEDPKINEIEQILPGANCGGCGYPGCRNFAEECVKASDLSDIYCPVGGNECMELIAKVLGQESHAKSPKVAVVRCNGTLANCQKINEYDGVPTCAIASNLYGGETQCQYGCLGYGDCVNACKFDAMVISKETGLPIINDDKCTACGACVLACPRHLIELRKKRPRDRKIYVSCMNEDRGGAAKNICKVACTGCSLCLKECKFDAITIKNFLSYIDPEKCTLCRKCVSVCPTNAIREINFPLKKDKQEINKENKEA